MKRAEDNYTLLMTDMSGQAAQVRQERYSRRKCRNQVADAG